MRRLFVLVVLELLIFAVAASAQTLSPIVSEYNRPHARGTFTATNNALVPQVVTVRPYSFSVVAGKTGFRELDSTVHIKLSETSAKLSPRSPHSFDYDLICDQSPCAVVFVVTFAGQKVNDAVKLEISLPHSAYICTDRKKDCRKFIREQVWGLPVGQ